MMPLHEFIIVLAESIGGFPALSGLSPRYLPGSSLIMDMKEILAEPT
jgi:hypothetical protein